MSLVTTHKPIKLVYKYGDIECESQAEAVIVKILKETDSLFVSDRDAVKIAQTLCEKLNFQFRPEYMNETLSDSERSTQTS